MKVLVLAIGCLTAVLADVSHITGGYNYNLPSSYNIPLNSVGSFNVHKESFVSSTPSTLSTVSSGNIQLPVHEQASFTSGAFNPGFSTTSFGLSGGNTAGFDGFSSGGFGGNGLAGFNAASGGLGNFASSGLGGLGNYQTTTSFTQGANFGSQDSGNAGVTNVRFDGHSRDSGNIAYSGHSASGSSQNVEVSKHLYFYAAPEEPEQPRSHVEIPAGPARKNVRILFIKAPTYNSAKSIHVAAQPQVEDKTLVYVLVKKPEDQAAINVAQQPAAPPSKPEVYFVKYKTQQDAQNAIAQIQNGASGAGGASVSANYINGDQAFISAIGQGSAGSAQGASEGSYSSGGSGGSYSSFSTSAPSVSFVSTGSSDGSSHFSGSVSSEPAAVTESFAHGSESAEGSYTSGSGSVGGVSGGSEGSDNSGSSGYYSGSISSGSSSGGSSGSGSSGYYSGSISSGSSSSTDSSAENSSEDNNNSGSSASGSYSYTSGSGQSSGGWYILKDWNKYDFDMNVLLEKLHVRYGVSPYFKISVEPHPLNPNENGIRIGPGGLGLPNKEYYYTDDDKIYQTAYQSLIREVVINFGASAVDANKFGTDLFSYEKRIAEITPNLETLQNPISIYNTRRLSELMNDITNIKFDEILIAMFPESNITESTEIIITSEKYLTDISQIIASTNNQLLNSYLIWTLVHHYVPYLSDDFVTTIDSYKTQILGVQPDGKEKWEVCSLLTKRFMGFALDVFIDKQDPIDNEVKSTINNTFHSILSVVKKKMRFVENEPLLYKYLKQKFSTIQLQIGLPDVVKEETYLKKYFTQLKVIKTDLFQSILNSVLFERKLKEKRLNKRLLEDTLLYYLRNNEVPKVQYLASENIVFVPRILLSKTLIEDKSPKAVVYGRIGIEIAEAILSSILPYGSFWSANKKILSPFHSIVNDSIISIESQRKCLFDYILGFNLDLPYSLANETALNLFKHVSAVSVANEALINSLVNEQHIHQPSLENFEDTALFFLTYSQTQCSESTSQYQFYRKVSHFELPQRTFLLIVWSQLQKFPSAFQCSGFKKNQQCSDIF